MIYLLSRSGRLAAMGREYYGLGIDRIIGSTKIHIHMWVANSSGRSSNQIHEFVIVSRLGAVQFYRLWYNPPTHHPIQTASSHSNCLYSPKLLLCIQSIPMHSKVLLSKCVLLLSSSFKHVRYLDAEISDKVKKFIFNWIRMTRKTAGRDGLKAIAHTSQDSLPNG
eukprot:1333282-Amorphochlora_amoeboformis.AAC.1